MAAPAPDAGPSEDERGLKRPLDDGGIDAETEERALLSITGFLLRAPGDAAAPLPPKGVAEAILKNADCHSFLAECMTAIGESSSGEVQLDLPNKKSEQLREASLAGVDPRGPLGQKLLRWCKQNLDEAEKCLSSGATDGANTRARIEGQTDRSRAPSLLRGTSASAGPTRQPSARSGRRRSGRPPPRSSSSAQRTSPRRSRWAATWLSRRSSSRTLLPCLACRPNHVQPRSPTSHTRQEGGWDVAENVTASLNYANACLQMAGTGQRQWVIHDPMTNRVRFLYVEHGYRDKLTKAWEATQSSVKNIRHLEDAKADASTSSGAQGTPLDDAINLQGEDSVGKATKRGGGAKASPAAKGKAKAKASAAGTPWKTAIRYKTTWLGISAQAHHLLRHMKANEEWAWARNGVDEAALVKALTHVEKIVESSEFIQVLLTHDEKSCKGAFSEKNDGSLDAGLKLWADSSDAIDCVVRAVNTLTAMHRVRYGATAR